MSLGGGESPGGGGPPDPTTHISDWRGIRGGERLSSWQELRTSIYILKTGFPIFQGECDSRPWRFKRATQRDETKPGPTVGVVN